MPILIYTLNFYDLYITIITIFWISKYIYWSEEYGILTVKYLQTSSFCNAVINLNKTFFMVTIAMQIYWSL